MLIINSSLAREIYASAGGAVIRFDRGPDRTLTAEQWAEFEPKLGAEQILVAGALRETAMPARDAVRAQLAIGIPVTPWHALGISQAEYEREIGLA